MRDWLFRVLFREEHEHMVHLVDDVVRLEGFPVIVFSDTATKTTYEWRDLPLGYTTNP